MDTHHVQLEVSLDSGGAGMDNNFLLLFTRAGHATIVKLCDNDYATKQKSFSDLKKYEKCLGDGV